MKAVALCLLRCLFSLSFSSLFLSLAFVNNEQTLWKQMLPLHQPLQRDPLEKMSLFKNGKRSRRAASKCRLTDVRNGPARDGVTETIPLAHLWLSTMNDNDIRHGSMQIPNLTLEKPSLCAVFALAWPELSTHDYFHRFYSVLLKHCFSCYSIAFKSQWFERKNKQSMIEPEWAVRSVQIVFILRLPG